MDSELRALIKLYSASENDDVTAHRIARYMLKRAEPTQLYAIIYGVRRDDPRNKITGESIFDWLPIEYNPSDTPDTIIQRWLDTKNFDDEERDNILMDYGPGGMANEQIHGAWIVSQEIGEFLKNATSEANSDGDSDGFNRGIKASIQENALRDWEFYPSRYRHNPMQPNYGEAVPACVHITNRIRQGPVKAGVELVLFPDDRWLLVCQNCHEKYYPNYTQVSSEDSLIWGRDIGGRPSTNR